MKNHSYKLKGLVAALALAGIAGFANAGPVNDAMLLSDAGASWLHTNGNLAGWRYSTLNQINTGNAKRLKVAWMMSPGGKNDAQGTPSVHDGVVYYPQDNKVWAIDGTTGRVVWKYEHKLPDDWGGYNVPFVTGKHRGLALSGGNVYFLSNDAKLHSIDMKTGKANWVKAYRRLPLSEGLRQSQGRERLRDHRRPDGNPGWHPHRADERHRLRRAARLRAGRECQRRCRQVEGQHDPGPRREGRRHLAGRQHGVWRRRPLDHRVLGSRPADVLHRDGQRLRVEPEEPRRRRDGQPGRGQRSGSQHQRRQGGVALHRGASAIPGISTRRKRPW